MFEGIEFTKLCYELPNTITVGVENVGTVLVYVDPDFWVEFSSCLLYTSDAADE